MITPSFGLTATERVLPRLALDWTTGLAQTGVDVARAGVATFVNSNGLIQSASINTQRVDWSTGVAGLLVEESRANILLQSEAFNTASWVKTRCSISADSITSPSGLMNADKQIEDTSVSSDHRLQQLVTVVTATNYNASIFLLAGERTVVEVLVFNGASFGGATINLTNGVASAPQTGGTTNLSATTVVTPYINNWYRVVIPITTAGVLAGIRSSLSNGASTTYTGNGASGAYLYGAQLEAGAFATSYIPTEATAVTRNADVATMTGTNFSDFYNPTEGGVVVHARPYVVTGTRPAVQFDDNTADELIALRGVAADPQLFVVDGGVTQATLDAGTIAANTLYKLGGAWKDASYAVALNGAAPVTQSSGTFPTATQARLGSDGTNYLNGHLQNLRFWPQRLTNAEVQAFSK